MGNFVLIFLGTIAVVWYAVSNDASTLNDVVSTAKQDQQLIGFALFLAAQPVLFIVYQVVRKRQQQRQR